MNAILSSCKQYRYCLTRTWHTGKGTVLFIMLNPSTANAETDDPTIRRCIGFARKWGFQQLTVGNLFALRATNPQQIKQAIDPVGPENDQHLIKMSASADGIITAWGTRGSYLNRDSHVLDLLPNTIEHLGLTKQGHPRHPLYVRADAVRIALYEENN